MRPFRVVLDDHLLPVQAYLNCWPDSDFLPMLRQMAMGVESSYNDVGWSWWGGEDDIPPAPGTLCFYLPGEEVTLPADEALTHIEQATEAWIASHTDASAEARSVLAQIRQRFLQDR